METNYIEHKVFVQLSEYADFYNSLSDSVFYFRVLGTGSGFNINSYVYSSMQGTLLSIGDILKQVRINDSYALLRKYYDCVIINIYSTLYLEDNFSIDNFIVEKINGWVEGRDRLPKYRIMSDYIRKSPRFSNINSLLYKDDTYKIIRDRCNDHTHYNFFYNVIQNDNSREDSSRMKALDLFYKDLENIFILHFAYLFTLNAHCMSSSDYTDYLDAGLIPDEGMQYWVAPFIQDIFDNVLKKNRLDIAIALKENIVMNLD